MGMKRIFKVLGAGVIAVAVGLTTGAMVASAVNPGEQSPEAVEVGGPDSVPFKYPVNDTGLTYGSLSDATSVGNTPDLVLVELSDGTTGYINGPELIRLEESGSEPTSPDEALQKQAMRDAQVPVELTVYDVDGRSIIGTWEALTPEQ